MKKIISAVLVCMLLVCSVFALSSCGDDTLSGTYENAESGIVLTFDGDTIKYSVSYLETYDVEALSGTYSIEDGKISFTLTTPDLENDLLEAGLKDMVDFINSSAQAQTFAKDSDSITIAGQEFTKKK